MIQLLHIQNTLTTCFYYTYGMAGKVHPQMKILSSFKILSLFFYPHDILNMHACFYSVECKRVYFEKCFAYTIKVSGVQNNIDFYCMDRKVKYICIVLYTLHNVPKRLYRKIMMLMFIIS